MWQLPSSGPALTQIYVFFLLSFTHNFTNAAGTAGTPLPQIPVPLLIQLPRWARWFSSHTSTALYPPTCSPASLYTSLQHIQWFIKTEAGFVFRTFISLFTFFFFLLDSTHFIGFASFTKHFHSQFPLNTHISSYKYVLKCKVLESSFLTCERICMYKDSSFNRNSFVWRSLNSDLRRQ